MQVKAGTNIDENDDDRNADPEIIAGIATPTGEKWIQVSQGDAKVWIEAIDLANGGAKARAKLTRNGITVVSSQRLTKLQLSADAYRGYRAGLIAKDCGWLGENFVYGDGRQFAPAGQPLHNNEVEPIGKYKSAGTLKEWKRAITPLVAHQPACLFAISIPFLGPLLEVIVRTSWGIQNPIFDLCGTSSIGKSALLRLAGSVCGHDNADTGFAQSWRLTRGGIDLLMPQHSSMFLGLDEASLAGEDENSRAKLIASVVHIIANGTQKTSLTQGVASRSFRLATLSTSNSPLLDMLHPADAQHGPLSARLLTIIVPSNRPYGILSYLPKGFENSGQAIDQLKTVTSTYYGTAMPHFLQRLVDERRANHGGLIAAIHKYASDFLAAIKPSNDGIELRRAKTMALAYAASRLARKWGALPLNTQVGSYLAAFQEMWRWTKPNDAVNRVRLYVRNHKAQFRQVDRLARVRDSDFTQCPGFLKKVKGVTELLIPTEAARRSFTLSDVKVLKAADLLSSEKGRFDIKRAVRSDKAGKPVQERFLAIKYKALSAN